MLPQLIIKLLGSSCLLYYQGYFHLSYIIKKSDYESVLLIRSDDPPIKWLLISLLYNPLWAGPTF